LGLFTYQDLDALELSLGHGDLRKSEKEVLAGIGGKDARQEHDVFLCHSTLDKRQILLVRESIVQRGFSVYVDWIDDPQMRHNKVTLENVKSLRGRMKRCQSLVYAFSNGSKRSMWMPWELGLFDGMGSRVAILPIVRIPMFTYSGQEYLGLYPYITKEENKKREPRLWVRRDAHTYAEFGQWLKGKEPATSPSK